jgi:hypothetical protein
MARKRVLAELQYLSLKFTDSMVSSVRILREDDISHHKRAGYGILSCPHQRHPNLRMPIDDGFYLLRMDLESPDVDHPVSPPDEIVAVTPQFDHIFRVYKIIRSSEIIAAVADVPSCCPG